jgi:DNA-binding MarR family transcriptional regulator
MCNYSADLLQQGRLGAWRAVLSVHANVVAQVETALAEADLPPLAWYDVLWALYRAPKRRLRMSQVADELTVSRSTFSRLADRLAREGLIRIEAAPDDGRSRHAILTPAGTQMLRRMWPVYERELDRVFPRLNAAEAKTLARLLSAASAAAPRRRGTS